MLSPNTKSEDCKEPQVIDKKKIRMELLRRRYSTLKQMREDKKLDAMAEAIESHSK
jgi:hypothetical protein